MQEIGDTPGSKKKKSPIKERSNIKGESSYWSKSME